MTRDPVVLEAIANARAVGNFIEWHGFRYQKGHVTKTKERECRNCGRAVNFVGVVESCPR